MTLSSDLIKSGLAQMLDSLPKPAIMPLVEAYIGRVSFALAGSQTNSLRVKRPRYVEQRSRRMPRQLRQA